LLLYLTKLYELYLLLSEFNWLMVSMKGGEILR